MQMSDLRDLDFHLGSGHTAYRRVSLIDLYLQTKFHSNRKTFLCIDGRRYGRKTDTEAGFIRST